MGVYDSKCSRTAPVIAAGKQLPAGHQRRCRIAELAKAFDEPGQHPCQDEAGGIVVSLASLRFAAAPTRSRLASARIGKCAYLAQCQNNNDQRSRNETYRGFEECRRARRRRLSASTSRDVVLRGGTPSSPSYALGRCSRPLIADGCSRRRGQRQGSHSRHDPILQEARRVGQRRASTANRLAAILNSPCGCFAVRSVLQAITLGELLQHRLGLFQVERVEALGEPVVDASEQIAVPCAAPDRATAAQGPSPREILQERACCRASDTQGLFKVTVRTGALRSGDRNSTSPAIR